MELVDTKMLTESFRLRARQDEVEQWKSAASEEGLSVAEWLRQQASESPTAKDAHRAHQAVTKALSDGILTRQPCEQCGAAAIAHHDDYSKPLEVRWLCRKHHRLWHKDNPSGIKWTQLSVYDLPDSVYVELTALAKERRWSVSKTAATLLEESLISSPVQSTVETRILRTLASEEFDVGTIREETVIKNTSRPKNYDSEPFSVVCPRRASHQMGTYCSECKGDGARR